MMMRLVSYFAIIQPKWGLVKENVNSRVGCLAAASALLACHGSIWPDSEEQNNKINDKRFVVKPTIQQERSLVM